LIVGAAAASVMLGCLGVAIVLARSSFYERSELERKVQGATEFQVRRRLGTPDQEAPIGVSGGRVFRSIEDAYDAMAAEALSPSGMRWTYKRRTRNPVTGEPDAVVHIIFRNGRVQSVHYE
jgi:hypothetical protein